MKTGFFKAKVVAINPDSEWIEKNTGESEEPEYLYTTRKGIRGCVIDIYLQSPTEDIFKYAIKLEESEKTSKTGAIQYINCLGDTQYVTSEESLFDSFKYFEQILSWKKGDEIFEKYKPGAVPNEKEIVGKKQYKIAIEGEDHLLHFVRSVENPNLYDIDSNILLDTDKLFSGNFSTLQKLLGSRDLHFVAFAYIDKNMQQKVFNKFLKLEFYRDIMNDMTISSYNKKAFEEWNKSFQAYCSECYYNMGRLQDFKEEFIKTKQVTDDGSDY